MSELVIVHEKMAGNLDIEESTEVNSNKHYMCDYENLKKQTRKETNICEVCQKGFSTPGYLKRHMRTRSLSTVKFVAKDLANLVI